MFASKSLIRQANSPFKGLILLFLTIILGLGSVMVLADLDIQTNIQNARQTIQRVTITSNGTDAGTKLIDFNNDASKIFISTAILNAQTSFSGNVLGLNTAGELIYVPSSGLIISGATYTPGGTGDTYWSGVANDIRNKNSGNVNIGAGTATGRLYVGSTADTQLVLKEENAGSASNMRFQNTANIRKVGGNADAFYIARDNEATAFHITSGGNIGIRSSYAAYKLDVDGTGRFTKDVLVANKLGVGTTNPVGQLQVGDGMMNVSMGKADMGGGADWMRTYIGWNIARQDNGTYISKYEGTNNGGNAIMANAVGGLYFVNVYGTATGVNQVLTESDIFNKVSMYINPYGAIGMGTTNPANKLHVAGTGQFSGLKITSLTNTCLGADGAGNIVGTGCGSTSVGGESLRSTGTNGIYYNLGNVGIGMAPAAGTNKLQVSGDVVVSGANGYVTASAYYYNSDKNLKKNISPIASALEKINALNGYMFTWRSNNRNDMGVIAQEVETVFPEIVNTDIAGYKSVEYGNLVAPLIEAIKELSKKVEQQAKEIEQLKNR